MSRLYHCVRVVARSFKDFYFRRLKNKSIPRKYAFIVDDNSFNKALIAVFYNYLNFELKFGGFVDLYGIFEDFL